MKRFLLLFFGTFLITLVLVIAGGLLLQSTVAAADESSPVASTATSEPVSTVEPTSTPPPTSTQEPTVTIEPSATEGLVTPPSTQTEQPTATSSVELESPTATAPAEPMAVAPETEPFTIFIVDEQGEPLTDGEGGACFYINSPFYWNTVCDAYDGPGDGIIQESLQPGEYWLSEGRAPAGYGPAEPGYVTIVSDGPNELTVVNEPRPILTIHKVNEDGEPLTDDQGGACFELTSSEGWRQASTGKMASATVRSPFLARSAHIH